ncbi:hypothetical protein CTAYLR_008963 [Chrysophaeum taylorii]|uniref:FAD-dependent oxidoreductase 2 FAD-binding domain-containing protein n=1 Tax=Chrysophaeum taylorii TaxID=2483200 RepID=A0AAD7UK39_9STRA|nr:hypothetical protein CTAYLR_008963 [Chrysophaeum taylorii]
MIMMMLRVVVVSIFAGIGQGLPDKVQCGQAIEVGSVLMAGLPAAAETEFDFATIKLSREGEAIECGGTYVPGERIDATLVAAAGTRWLFDLENGTFSGASASCGGRRSEGASTFVAPFSSSSSTSLRLRLRAGFASSYGVVTVTEDCVIYAAGRRPPTTATAAPTTAAPSTVAARRYETDVLVVGAGLAGVTAAWAARQADPDANVTILAASLSDVTTAYSGGWLWLPNNGLGGGGEEEEDPMEEFVAHVAGIAFPSSEEAPAWARENLAAFWEFSPRAMEDLREVVDWTLQHDLAGEAFPDYYGGESTSYPNNTMPRGRVVRATSKDDGTSPLSGAELLALIRDAADASLVLEGYLAVDVIQEPDGSTTVAARSTDKENQEVLVSAARGVVFATGGRIRRGDGEKSYGLDASVVGSCSSPDSTGAAMDAVAALDGVEIASKGNAWQYEVDSAGTAQWFLWYGQPGGDFIVVDGNGDRVYDESLSYNQRAEFHVTRRVVDGESVVEDNPAWSQLYLVYGDGAKTTYSGSIDAVDEVATNIDGAKTAVEAAPWFQGGTLSETFEDNLRASIEAFNAAASGDGIDPFGRGVPGTEGYDSSIAWWQFGLATAGKFPIQEIGYGGNPLTQPFANDPMMMMIYVRPLNYGAIDTKMGPRTDASQRVVGTHNVYAAGNAAASPFGQAYAAPGNTLGFALVSGYVAGTNAAAEYVLEWTGVPFEVRAGRRTLPKSSENQVLQLVVVVVQDDDSSSSIVVARSYGGHPWEGLMPRPLDVECDIVCSALVPEGTWLLGFEREEEEEEEAPAAAAAASRFLAQATFGPTTEAIDTFVDEYGSDPESWIRDQMTVVPASLHRDYFRERAYPLMTETCNGEAGTDETLGARYSWYYGTSFSSHSQLDVPYEPENGKGMVFANLALGARDQLRQRVAWALSHIYVVSVEDVPEARDEIEVWLEYYDIFVRHAFGNLRDVLRDVSFSPMMAHYLTYLGSAQYDGNDGFPDENYAREFMQLFTVGLRDLNRNGTFTGLETYASDDILTGARLWTGFDAPPLRSNVEALRPDNYIDDLAVYPERRDPFPKANLYGGYIGDRRPLCKYNNPLGAGAAFEYLGTTLSRSVSSSSTLVLDDEKYDGPLAALYAALCGEKIDGTCSFPEKKKTVMLSESLITPESFNATTVAIRDDDDGKIAAVYKYVPAPCVNMAFFDDAIQATDYQGRSICADPEAPFWHQELLVSPSIDRTCAVKVQVHKLGAVNIVHEPSSSWIRAWELSLDSDRLFRVPWANGDHPTAESGCDGCATRGVTCLCSTTVSVAAAFLDEIPSREEVLATLFIGSPVGDPSSNEEAYAHYGTVGGVAAYATKTTGVLDEDAIFVVENEVGTPIFLTNKVSTVHLDAGFSFRNAPHFVPFAVEAPSKHEVVAETEALIDHLFEHHNTAPFLAKLLIQRFVTSNPSPRYVEAVADAFRAGEYYGGGGGQTYYSGEYGDLGATIAAILLDREARSPAVLADPTYGRLREPLVKVLHFMRAMEFESTDGREVEFEGLAARIGQMVHEAPSVFSFYYPDYSPPGVVGDKMLVAPEAQVMTGTNLIGFANGLHSMIKYGLTRCNQGFGGGTGSCAWPADGGLMFAPTTDQALDIVDELDVLLTDGRLSNASKRTIANAIASETTPANGLKKAQELFVLTPEFHATNIHVPGRPRDETPPEAPSSAKFKAVVMLFLYGGEDSYTVLTPHSQCEYQNRLAGQYRDYRGPVADMPFDVTDDYLLVEPRPDTQPCEVFGMHPSLQNVHDMYQQGEASWFANIGPLVEPITVEELRAGTKRTPPSVGAHDVQQRIAQSVHSDNMNARGVMGRILNAINIFRRRRLLRVLADPTGSSKLNAVGFSLDGSPKALEGSGAADIVDLNSLGFSRLVDYDKLKADIDALTDPVSQSIFAETYASLLGPAIANAEEIAHIFEDDQGLTAEFGDARLSQRFKDIARIINKREAFGYERAAFFVSIGGFDTHGTLERLPGMLTEIDDALGSFVEEMRAQGVFDDVAVATMSDFGRTLTWNGQGTDHGWGGHHLIVSGGLNGSQIHGHYPKTLGPDGDMNINSGRGVIIPTTPWESMWAPLAKFMGVVDEDMDYVIPNIRNFPDVLGLSDVFEVGPTRAPTLIPTPAPSRPVARAVARPDDLVAPDAGTDESTHDGTDDLASPDDVAAFCITSSDTASDTFKGTHNGTGIFDENSCPVGFDIWVPKSYQHAKAVIDAVDRKFTYVVGVYREENGCGGCTQWAMNSEAQATYEAEAKGNRGWKSIAGEPWFMRETTYNEPNGNYRGDCWLTTNWGGGWEDGIGFRMDDSGGQEGNFEYGEHTLHCLEVNDEIVNVLAITNGERTCKRTDANSCPDGFDVWVPRSYDHAKAVRDLFGGSPYTDLVGIYREEDGCGGCTRLAMNSQVQLAYEAESKENVGWKSVAGNPWFMRETTFNEPNGDYTADCWLTTRWGTGWEDDVGFS